MDLALPRRPYPPRDRIPEDDGLLVRVPALAQRAARALPLPAAAVVGEAPSGIALLSLELLRRGFRPQPAEPDEGLRQRSRDQLHGKRVLDGDLDRLPFADGSLDGVASLYGLCALQDGLRPRALGEIDRVLKPGGRFVLAELGAWDRSSAPAAIDLDIHELAHALLAQGFRLRLQQFSDYQWVIVGGRTKESVDGPFDLPED